MFRLLLLLASCVCFCVALLISAGVVSSSLDGWLAGGLLSFSLATLLPLLAPYAERTPAA